MATMDPFWGVPTQLSPEQTQASDPRFAASHPGIAARDKPYNPFYGPNTAAYRWGGQAMQALSRPNVLGSILNRGPLAGGALGAGIGALAGGTLGAVTGRDTGRSAILGALLAGGIGAYSGHVRSPGYKQAGWRSDAFGDPRQAITEALQNSSMGFNQKMQILSAVPRLDDSQARQLSQAIRGVGGMAVGALISRYLLGWGLLGTLAGGALGGVLGSSMYQGPRDAMGYKSMNGRDFSGHTLSL